jgi:hypothetical protein
MVKFNFFFDIYHTRLQVIVGDVDEDLIKYVSKYTNASITEIVDMFNETTSGCCFYASNGKHLLWVAEWDNSTSCLTYLVHEIEHYVFKTMEWVGIPHTKDTDEAFAYFFDLCFFTVVNKLVSHFHCKEEEKEC